MKVFPKKYMGQTIMIQKNLRWPKCPIFWVPILSFLYFFSVSALEGQGSPPAGSNVIKLTSLNVLHTDMYFTYLDWFMVLLLIDFHFFVLVIYVLSGLLLEIWLQSWILIRDVPLSPNLQFLEHFSKRGGGQTYVKKYRFRDGILT